MPTVNCSISSCSSCYCSLERELLSIDKYIKMQSPSAEMLDPHNASNAARKVHRSCKACRAALRANSLVFSWTSAYSDRSQGLVHCVLCLFSVYVPAFPHIHCTYLWMDGQAELIWVVDYTCMSYWDNLPAERQSPIQVLTSWESINFNDTSNKLPIRCVISFQHRQN